MPIVIKLTPPTPEDGVSVGHGVDHIHNEPTDCPNPLCREAMRRAGWIPQPYEIGYRPAEPPPSASLPVVPPAAPHKSTSLTSDRELHVTHVPAVSCSPARVPSSLATKLAASKPTAKSATSAASKPSSRRSHR